MSQRETRMMTTGRMKGKRVMKTMMTILQEGLPKIRMIRRRRRMRMMPSSLTPTLSPPNVGLGASGLNKTSRSLPW